MKTRTFLGAMTLIAIPGVALAFGNGPAASHGSAAYGGNGDMHQMQNTKKPKPMKSPVPKFKKVDKNGNGKISWKEAKAVGVPKKIFKKDDFNHNGTLNRTQWMFVRLDMKNKDSKPGSGLGQL